MRRLCTKHLTDERTLVCFPFSPQWVLPFILNTVGSFVYSGTLNLAYAMESYIMFRVVDFLFKKKINKLDFFI